MGRKWPLIGSARLQEGYWEVFSKEWLPEMFFKNGEGACSQIGLRNSLEHIIFIIHVSIKSTEKVFSKQHYFIQGDGLKQTNWRTNSSLGVK